jgi:uncharacterized ion transporter superfamily protein YfcC
VTESSTAGRLRLPHPFVLLLGGVALAAALTWVIPAGAYQRATDAATGREIVVPGSYRPVPPTPVGPMAALVAVPRGMVAGADVILVILFVAGAFTLLDETGALRRLISAGVGRSRRPWITVVVVSLVFAVLGAVENMQEEIIALVPVLLLLSARLGFGTVTALAMSAGAAMVGSAFGPTNPFQTGPALRFAGLPGLTLPGLRFTLLGLAVAVWIGYTIMMAGRDDVRPETGPAVTERATARDVWLLVIALVPFVPYVYGVVRLGFGFNELTAFFLVAGYAIGLVSGRTINQTTVDFLRAAATLLPAALIVGLARAISLVLADGHVIDTIIQGLATELSRLPRMAAALGMIPAQALLHVPVSSVSGQAALAMPIMAPVADLLHVSRDAAVIAYQTGAGLMDAITPTNGSLLAILLAARLGYGRWLRFAAPGMLLVALVGVLGVVLAA